MTNDNEEVEQITLSSTDDGYPAPDAAETESSREPCQGLVIGRLIKLCDDGPVQVSYPGNPSGSPTGIRSIIPLPAAAIGREVALMFENGDIENPIIIGILQPLPASSSDGLAASSEGTEDIAGSPAIVMEDPMPPSESELTVDGRKISLQASEQIVLRCGKSSITMTRAGKVIIRGAYVSSKSSGANRIKGGSVQIN